MSRKPRIADDVLDAVREDDIANMLADLCESEHAPSDSEDAHASLP